MRWIESLGFSRGSSHDAVTTSAEGTYRRPLARTECRDRARGHEPTPLKRDPLAVDSYAE